MNDSMEPRSSQVEVERVFYFDIDGTLLDFSDAPKAALRDGVLQRALIDLGFDRYVCVSGWCDALRSAAPRVRADLSGRIWRIVRDLFPDEGDYQAKCLFAFDTYRRCQHIDRTSDW